MGHPLTSKIDANLKFFESIAVDMIVLEQM